MGKASVCQADRKVLVIPRGFLHPDCCVGRHQAPRAHQSIVGNDKVNVEHGAPQAVGSNAGLAVRAFAQPTS